MSPHPLDPLLALMRRAFATPARDPAAAEEAARVLAALPVPGTKLEHNLVASEHGLLTEIPAVLAALPPEWQQALAPLAARLPWRYSYAPRPDAPGLASRMGWAELVGPAAPVHSDLVGFGLTLISGQTYYPPHSHPAVELYRVLAGTSEWTLEGRTSLRQAGDFILHPAHAIHAMRALDAPLLALYSWSGDIVSPTVYV